MKGERTLRPKPEFILRPGARPTYNAGRGRTRIQLPRIPVEAGHLLIAWMALGFAFSFRHIFRSPEMFPLMLAISLGTAGSGFILHELAHKFSARRYGCWAEFRLWPWGLMMALIFAFISGGGFIFAAPGATYIVSNYLRGLTKKENGLISLAGPLTNLALAGVFYSLAMYNESLLFKLIGATGYQINLWLAAFNLIPLGGLDGQKVLSWSIPVWMALAVPLWIIVALQLFSF